ncbi:MAG TPA: hypothetical protein VGX48_08825 [Pyrinomonadaceae bacterium]|jgi:hypothetical protein|nr:hypothetical protein [Pyrinomonadaceae bacterium]
MRLTLTAAILLFFALSYACGGGAPTTTTNTRNSAPANSAQKTGADVGVAASHGGGSAAPAAAGSSDKPSVATPELDAKIQKAEAKAKAPGASDADKKAAADAYFERADFYRDQGMPVLYKFALRDYRIGLRYDSTNSDARAKMDEIIQIYKGLGRPVPELGNEP